MRIIKAIVSFFLNASTYLIKRKPNWIVFGSWSGEHFIDNPRYIYEYLLTNNSEYKLIWIGNECIKDQVPQTKQTLFVKKGSLKSIYFLLKSKYVFISQTVGVDLTPFNVFRDAVIVHCWHGVPVKKIGAHMEISKKTSNRIETILINLAKKLLKFPIQYSYFISSSPKNDEVFASAFKDIGATYDNMLKSGYPRNDQFFNVQPERLREFKHRYSQLLEFPMDKKIILYLPTYRRKKYSVESFCNRNEDDTNALNKILAKHNTVLIEKNHFQTYAKASMACNDSPTDLIIRLNKDDRINIQEILLFTDILISDYSGAFLDFTLLDRPIIHYAYDYEYYRDVDSGLYYDIDDFSAGKVATTFEEVLEELENLLNGNDEYKEKREYVRNEYMTYEQGNACEYICNKVLKYQSRHLQ